MEESAESNVSLVDRQKTNNETCTQNLQSCMWLMIWLKKFGSGDSDQICWRQTPTRRHIDKDNFTREWNNLLHLCNIRHFNLIYCSQNFSSVSCPKTMTKRMQKGHEEERTMTKSKLTLNLTPETEASSWLCWVQMHSSVREYSEHLIRKNWFFKRARDNQYQRPKSKWRSVEFSNVTKRCRKTRDYKETRCNRNEPRSSVFLNVQRVRGDSCTWWKKSESIDDNDTVCSHHLHISTAYAPRLEKVFSNVRPTFGRKGGQQNGRFWCKYVNTGNIYDRHSSSRNSFWKRICGEFTFLSIISLSDYWNSNSM